MELDKNDLITQARDTYTALMDTLEAFTPDNFNQGPVLGGWTAGQVAEHLLLSAGVVEIIAGRTETAHRPADEKADALAAIFLDFTIKLSSPDFILPAKKTYDQQEMTDRLKTVWTKLKEAIRLLDLKALCLDSEIPTIGTLTRLEWIYFYVIHTQRHLRQLKALLLPAPSHHRLPLPGR
jgi:DinB superfamily